MKQQRAKSVEQRGILVYALGSMLYVMERE